MAILDHGHMLLRLELPSNRSDFNYFYAHYTH